MADVIAPPLARGEAGGVPETPPALTREQRLALLRHAARPSHEQQLSELQALAAYPSFEDDECPARQKVCRTVVLTMRQERELALEAAESSVSVSEIVWRILDQWSEARAVRRAALAKPHRRGV